tara:strand:- start:1066 stop:1419 length:354 start_codon:yes stop_codon:yes gene_type:complete
MKKNNKHQNYYGLPQDVHFCAECVISNQRPSSAIEFLNTIDLKKTVINFDKNKLCSACEYNKIKNTINWDQRNKELKKICDQIKKKEKILLTMIALFQEVVERIVRIPPMFLSINMD